MTDSKDFLISFTQRLKEQIGKEPIGLYDVLSSLPYSAKYQYDDAYVKLEEMKEVLDKILAILYHPHIIVQTNEIVLRSELSGKLSHESFQETMLDAKLWKEKSGEMVPEYVHSVETIDSIHTYENRFIALLIDEMDEAIDRVLAELNPLMESIEEHYQHKEMSFGKYSPFHDMRKNRYPYSSFFLQADDTKDKVYNLARRIKRKTKNMKGTEFYKINCKPKLSKNVIPTNILIHDKLYSFCYRYHVEHFRKAEQENRKREIMYYNYFLTSFVNCIRKLNLLPDDPSLLSFGREGILELYPFAFDQFPFEFHIKADPENLILKIQVQVKDNERVLSETNDAIIIRELYNEENKKQIQTLRDHLILEEHYDTVLLATMNNILREVDHVMTFTYYKEDTEVLLGDLLTSMTILFEGNKELYTGFCPICGHNHIRYDGSLYQCGDCQGTYHMFDFEEKNLLWIRSYRKE